MIAKAFRALGACLATACALWWPLLVVDAASAIATFNECERLKDLLPGLPCAAPAAAHWFYVAEGVVLLFVLNALGIAAIWRLVRDAKSPPSK